MMRLSDLALSEGTEKFQQEEIADNSMDFLSNLPEVLTSHILSLLSTKEAVRTSVLSKSWEYKWIKIINLSFDDQMLYGRDRNRKENFMNFVDRVLFLICNPVIECFTLRGIDYYVASRVHAWISTAIRRRVRKLIVSCLVDGSLVFPRCIYDTTSLIEMDLEMICTFKVPTNVCFSSLKILHLSRVRFFNEHLPDSTEFNLSFPKLQELQLHSCRWELVQLINIYAPELSSCTVSYDGRSYGWNDVTVYNDMKIYAPKLCKFICGSYSNVHIILVNPSSTIDATIDLYSCFWHFEPVIAMLACDHPQQLCGVKHLTLSRRIIMKALCHEEYLDDLMVTFDFPLHLTITWGITALGELVKLFRRLPGLLSLTFSKGNPYGPAGYLPRCWLPNLKVVKILSFSGSGAELELAKFLLLNATALEEMIITSSENLHMDTERMENAVKEELQTVRWASSRVSITVVG